MLAKSLLSNHYHVKNNNYSVRNTINTFEINQKVLDIVGLESIGSKVSAIFSSSFNMKVLAYGPHVFYARTQAYGTIKMSLDKVLGRSDFVSLHCLLKELAKMKESAYLINIARGPVVSAEALGKKQISGVAFDIYEMEPPSQATLYSLDCDNVLFSPDVVRIS